jgi:hypothetical protein
MPEPLSDPVSTNKGKQPMVTPFRILIVPALLLAILGCAAKGNVGGAARGDKSIPIEYRVLYKELSEKLGQSDVQLGAGAGTWSPMTYFSALAKIKQLDYIDLHIYPVQRDFVINRVARIARTATAHNKKISIGEAWLYKVSQRELGRIKPVTAFARDVYSFWQPLDEMFVQILVGLSRRTDAEFCSLFWMKYLYGYVDYNSRTRDLAPQELINMSEKAAGRRILDNSLNQTGTLFQDLISD